MTILDNNKTTFFVVSVSDVNEFYGVISRVWLLGYSQNMHHVSLDSTYTDIILNTSQKEISTRYKNSHSRYYHLKDQENNYEYFTYGDFINHYPDKFINKTKEGISSNTTLTNLRMADLYSLMRATEEYLSYYDYNLIYGNEKVSNLVKRELRDKYTDENKLRSVYVDKLNSLGIGIKKEDLL